MPNHDDIDDDDNGTFIENIESIYVDQQPMMMKFDDGISNDEPTFVEFVDDSSVDEPCNDESVDVLQ